MTVREGYVLRGSAAMIRAHQGERYAADNQGQERLSGRTAIKIAFCNLDFQRLYPIRVKIANKPHELYCNPHKTALHQSANRVHCSVCIFAVQRKNTLIREMNSALLWIGYHRHWRYLTDTQQQITPISTSTLPCKELDTLTDEQRRRNENGHQE